ncbi:unnamed protein product, partial [marine sediment metagenome]
TMIEFATSIYIMDAGPSQAMEKTSRIFGLSQTAQNALRTRVHGPREGGATFLAIFSTKSGVNTQLLTLTLGPIELWSFSTTADDAIIRNRLYKQIGPREARRLLATLFPSGTITKLVDERLSIIRDAEKGLIDEEARVSVVDEILHDIMDAYSKDPNIKSLPTRS